MDDRDKRLGAMQGSRDDARAGLFAELTMALGDAVTVATAGQKVDLTIAEVHEALSRIERLLDQSSHITARLQALRLDA